MSAKTDFLESTGLYFHIYNRGVGKSRIFKDDRNYEFFLGRMSKYLDPSLPIIAYCLMPNHFHFLLRQDAPRRLSNYMGLVCKSYVLAFNKCFERSGHLFEGKYKLRHVDEEGYLLHLSRYIHLNPVRARLAKHAEDWPYSSCREYYGLRENRIVCCGPILQEFGDSEGYKKFIEAYVSEDKNRIAKYLLR
jgi:putative transposase